MIAGTSSQSPPTDTVSVSNRSQVSQITTNHSIMGGRNEQANNRNARQKAAVLTKRRILSSASRMQRWTNPPVNTAAENECDTNANTCCLGRNIIVLNSTFRTADVYAYDTSIQPLDNVPIVTGATAYDDATTRRMFFLVFHEALYYGERLDHSLINPNQLRAYGVPFWGNPYDSDHRLSIKVHSDLTIPLSTYGTKVGFRTCVPTQEELRDCEHIQVTSSQPWNPSDVVMIQETDQSVITPWQRRSYPHYHANENRYEYSDPNSDEALLHEIDPSLVLMAERMNKRQSISQIETVYDHVDTLAR